MKSTLLDTICCPSCKENLTFRGKPNNDVISEGKLLCENCQKTFPIEKGIVHFLHGEELTSLWVRSKFIRSLYADIYTPITNLMFLLCGGARNARHEVLDRLEIPSGAQILETGIGTGDNLPFLKEHLYGGTFCGIDIQQRMLRSCVKNIKKWDLHVDLFWADAEHLPFKEGTFDVVFHLGAINQFSDKKAAITEMIRVARPGTKIVIADDTEKASKFLRPFIAKQEKVVPPIDFVPEAMIDLRLDTIWKGYGYCIELRTPSA